MYRKARTTPFEVFSFKHLEKLGTQTPDSALAPVKIFDIRECDLRILRGQALRAVTPALQQKG